MDPLQGEVETFPDNMDVAMSQGGGGGEAVYCLDNGSNYKHAAMSGPH